MSVDPAIADFYARAPEESRLEQGASRLEAARTRELIERHAPSPPAKVVDVGGAALRYFTTAYFHRPEELRDELAAAGFQVTGIYGVEGPGWTLPDFDARWSDAGRRATLIEVARMLESEPGMVGCSAHLLAVGRKP